MRVFSSKEDNSHCVLQEEALFKWEQTTYPEVETITRSVEPYMKLFSMVVKWQRAEKKWMDGAFQELNAELTEAEVCNISTGSVSFLP